MIQGLNEDLKSTNPVVVGDWVRFSIREGEIFSLLGPNGAGKTTLLHTLAGLRPAKGGDILIQQRAMAEY